MKIENCHPKIEDRIDLRLCPLASEQILSMSIQHLNCKTKSMKYILHKMIFILGPLLTVVDFTGPQVQTSDDDRLNLEMNISREGSEALEGLFNSGKKIKIWQEDDILLFCDSDSKLNV